MSKTITKGTLDETVQNLEKLVLEHEKAHKTHPHVMGYEDGFYSHKERAEDYRVLLGFLKELQHYKQGE